MLASCTSRSVTTGSANAARPSVEQADVAANATAAAANAIPFLISLLRVGRIITGRLRAGAPSQVFPPGDPLRDFLLERERTGLIEPRPAQRLRQILLRDVC